MSYTIWWKDKLCIKIKSIQTKTRFPDHYMILPDQNASRQTSSHRLINPPDYPQTPPYPNPNTHSLFLWLNLSHIRDTCLVQKGARVCCLDCIDYHMYTLFTLFFIGSLALLHQCSIKTIVLLGESCGDWILKRNWKNGCITLLWPKSGQNHC